MVKKTGIAGKALIKEFEGLHLKSYLCPGGVWTIGWGSTILSEQDSSGRIRNTPVRKGMTITEEQAENQFNRDLVRFENYVNNVVKVELTQNEFDALVSFAYNAGPEALGSSTLLRRLNANLKQEAADQFLVWNKATDPKTKKLIVLPGLVRRRKAERELFLKKD